MRRLFFFLILVPVIGFGQFSNRGFENWDAEFQSLPHWFVAEGASIQVDTIAFQGEYALRLESSTTVGSSYFLQVQKLDLGVPRRMTFSGMVNTQSADGWAGIFANVRGPKGRTFYHQVFPDRNQGWSRVKMEILVDAESEQFFIGGILGGEGHALFDQFEIVEKKLTDSADTEATQYIDEIGRIIREHSLMAKEVELDRLIGLGKRLVSADTTLEASYPVVDFMVNRLQDVHSGFMIRQSYQKWQIEGTSMAWSSGALQDNVAYLEIPGFRSGNAKQISAFADHLRKLIEKLALDNPTGWIIDLRAPLDT